MCSPHRLRVEQRVRQRREAVVPDERGGLPVPRHQRVVGPPDHTGRVVPPEPDHAEHAPPVQLPQCVVRGLEDRQGPAEAVASRIERIGQRLVPQAFRRREHRWYVGDTGVVMRRRLGQIAGQYVHVAEPGPRPRHPARQLPQASTGPRIAPVTSRPWRLTAEPDSPVPTRRPVVDRGQRVRLRRWLRLQPATRRPSRRTVQREARAAPIAPASPSHVELYDDQPADPAHTRWYRPQRQPVDHGRRTTWSGRHTTSTVPPYERASRPSTYS